MQTLLRIVAATIVCLGINIIAAPAAGKPNVIVVLTDDQGYGDLSVHGNPILKTPNMDRLHEQSIRLTDFHVAPMCTPTRGELLTGRDAVDNGATFVCMGRSLIREDIPTMADMFADSGFATGHFGKWHLGDNYPFRPQDRGFQETVHHGAWGITSLADYFGNDYFDDHYPHNGVIEQYKGYCTDVWFEEATRWIRTRAAADEPFFLYLPTNAPHVPLWVPDKYREPYEGKVPENVASFFGMIANIDENMGRLMAMLDETGLAENTILIFMSDNGTAQGEKIFNSGMRGKKRALYEGGHRVPFFLRWPGGDLGEPRDIDDLTHTQDVLPTLIELCGLKQPEGAAFDGTSLASLLRGKSDKLDDRMLVTQYGGELVKNHMAAVMWEKWRLVNGEELYNLNTDPGQKTNVVSEQPEVAKRMQRHYDQWWDDLMPAAQAHQPVVIGTEYENPARLSAADWNDVYCDNPRCYRVGAPLSGAWSIRVAEGGKYRFSLRRWPKEAGLSLAAGTGPLKGAYGDLMAGKAMPISGARIQIESSGTRVSEAKDVSRQAEEAMFEVTLPSGDVTLQTWFVDASGKELCGAYYVSAERLD